MTEKVACPDCKGELMDIGRLKYSLNVYECKKCGLRQLRCGNTNCDWYLEGKRLPWGEYHYKCTKCGWTGVSAKGPP